MFEKSFKHAPNRFKSYINIHNTVIERFKSSCFIGEDNLEIYPLPKKYLLYGTLGCKGNIVITISKTISILDYSSNGDHLVQTDIYAYNVSIEGWGNIFRYDNEDKDYLREGHFDSHHKHSYNFETKCEFSSSPRWVGKDKWPTLGDVIKEAEDWYWNYKDIYLLNDGYPSLVHKEPPSLEL